MFPDSLRKPLLQGSIQKWLRNLSFPKMLRKLRERSKNSISLNALPLPAHHLAHLNSRRRNCAKAEVLGFAALRLKGLKMSISPVLLSILVCDTTIRDIQSKKISLIGLFSNMVAKEIPFISNQFSLFVCLTEVIGVVPITIQIKNLLNDEIIVKDILVKIESMDSANPVEFVIALNNVVFPNFGQYAIELFGHGNLLGSIKIAISKTPNKDSL